MDIRRELEEIVVSNLDDDTLFLVDIEISANKGPRKIKVLIDGDNGLNIDDCAKISRTVAEAMEQKKLIESAFILEVSSPGLDYPLKFKRQYLKNIGRKLKVLLSNNIEKQGELIKVADHSITVNAEQKSKNRKIDYVETEIYFSDIKKTNVLVSFK
ncbi:ribosome maturation factor RimP [Fulvivirgaceae bacterium BMA12]|uniref:Ribosome maturation factor RimP n=1 Tax=Agaribacillus aureus TaxID=3051825 RepID=A0ABT8LD84_9BACT|nr:ribosome maturation factor RimP [Fulvivirgaceae bacterium BMA12]